MNNHDDREYWRSDPNKLQREKISHLPVSVQEKENKKLSRILTDLIRKAKHNQITQEKFYQLELYFLQSTSLTVLFDRLLKDLSAKLELELVELLLVDNSGDIQQLIKDIYVQLDHKNLYYLKNAQSLNSLYEDGLEIKLTQDAEIISSTFKQATKRVYSAALLPLVREKQIIGSLNLGSNNKQRFVPGLATSFLQHLSSIVGICVENAVIQEQFKLLSLVDLLTRTKNRRYFIQALNKEISRGTRSFNPISCLFLDLDHFKHVNDDHGHLTGDRALQAVASTIMPMLRQSDVLARFGGEEFTIMLPNTAQSHAVEIAERIRHEISIISILDDDQNKFSITVSIGVSTWQANSQTPMPFDEVQEQLISIADNGVYIAKEKGRNCVQIGD